MDGVTRTRQRNPKGEGSRLREELLEAAMRILDRAPATELSLRMVAKEAGVAPPSAYPHFASAEAMMLEIVRECWRQLADAMMRSAPPGQFDDPFLELKAQLDAYVRFALDRPSRYQLLFATQPMLPENYPERPGLLQPAYRQVLATVERILYRQPDPSRNAGVDALLAIAIVHGRVAIAHLAPDRPGNGPAAVSAFVADALDRLFRAPPK